MPAETYKPVPLDQVDTPFAEGEGPGPEDRYNVFLVEDDIDDRKLAVQTLRKSPFINDIRCFASGDKLIEYFVNEGYYSGNLMRYIPTLILLDIHVPGTDGLEILQRIREHPTTRDMPVIIITGDTSGPTIDRARKLQANAFVSKPLRMDQVHQVIYTGWGWPDGLPP